MDLKEKKELIVDSYSLTFDKEMAYKKVGLTSEEIVEFNEDQEFQNRLEIFLIVEREKVIKNLRAFMDSTDEKISFKATTDIGMILYKDFFDGLKEPVKETHIHLHGNSEEEDKRIAEEYGHILNGEKKVSIVNNG